MRLRFLSLAGILLATGLAVAACGTGQESHPAAATGTGQASSFTPAAPTSATPSADTVATEPATDSSGQSAPPTPPASPASLSAKQAGFTSALGAWKNAAAATAATMNGYFQQAADDLSASGYSGYDTAIAQLTYLAHLPATNDTPAQQANAHSDVRALDGFFGTRGLLS